MFLNSLIIRLIISKLILSLGYGGFLFYQPLIFSQPLALNKESVQAVNLQEQKDNQNFAVKSLPLSFDKIKLSPRLRPEAKFSLRLSAQSYAVVDETTETVLAKQAENIPRSIGSLSKLMTALVFLDNKPNWEKQITIEKSDEREGKVCISAGEKISVKNLFYASLVESCNTATIALARSSGLTLENFAKKMNQKALNLGLKTSSFVEPTGLNSNNQSSAREVAILLKNALKNEFISQAVLQKTYNIEVVDTLGKNIKRRVINTDELLSNDFKNSNIQAVVGAKTGFIEEAGYCFAVMTENKNTQKIITVILGAESHYRRFSEAKDLAEWVYQSYLWPGQEGFEKLSQNNPY